MPSAKALQRGEQYDGTRKPIHRIAYLRHSFCYGRLCLSLNDRMWSKREGWQLYPIHYVIDPNARVCVIKANTDMHLLYKDIFFVPPQDGTRFTFECPEFWDALAQAFDIA